MGFSSATFISNCNNCVVADVAFTFFNLQKIIKRLIRALYFLFILTWLEMMFFFILILFLNLFVLGGVVVAVIISSGGGCGYEEKEYI